VIKVGHDEMDMPFIPQFIENMEKADRVRAAGDSDNDTVPFGNHSVASDGVFDLLESLHGVVHVVLKIPVCPPLRKEEGETLPFVKGR
jgi:hypothetical protein